MNLAERIRAARERAGLNQAALGEAIGVESHAAISRYEAGKREPTLDQLKRIARICKVDAAWLVLGESPPSRTIPAWEGADGDMDIAEWISEGLARSGKSQRGLARALNIDASGVSRLLKGERQLRADELPVVERYLETDRPEGTAADDFKSSALTLMGSDHVAIPRYDAALSAGTGSIVDPNAAALSYQFFEMQWLRALTRSSVEHLAVVRVDGDSMEPTLQDGDWVLIDRDQRRLNRAGIYALAVGDAAWVKRITLNLRDRLIRVISDNAKYPMQELSEEDLFVIGRVVWIVGRKV